MATAAASRRETKKLVEQTTLRHLLDGLVVAQKQDIKAFSKGHLNESNLPKPPKKPNYRTWQSSGKPHINLVPRGTLPPAQQSTQSEGMMRDTMLNFSVGTAGTNCLPKKPVTSPVSKSSSDTRNIRTLRRSPKSDGVLIEELTLPETMLPKTNYPEPKSKQHPTQPDAEEDRRGTPDDSQLPDLRLGHTFIPAHLEAVTKRDQLLKMRQFEQVVLRKQDIMEQNVMSGVRAVEHIETKLKQDLDNLKHHGYGPNFHRLQVFSNIFHDLIQDSSSFGFILQTIKGEYDNYIASLMDGPTNNHQVLYNQVEQLAARDNNSQTLSKEMENVQYMESQAKLMLAENERLRKELDHEKYLETKPIIEQASSRERNPKDDKQDLMETVEELKSNILEKLDIMSALKMKLRREYVPSTVCSHLEQCIKETEVEIQKLTSQKEFFERSISDMEKELQDSIETADTTEKDARRVWKRVMAVKAVDRAAINGTPGAGVTTTGPGGASHLADSDDEQEDEQKWSWYIS